MLIIKPMRAENADLDKIRYPVWVEPKIDGVRALNQNGQLYTRPLKKHANNFTNRVYSQAAFHGLDGEMAANDERHPRLCNLTGSALSTQTGEPWLLWHLFDYVTQETRTLPYKERYARLCDKVKELVVTNVPMAGHLRVVPVKVCNNRDELEAAHEENMEAGYEGTCYYGPDVAHKEGKSSPRHQGVLRIKDFIDFEAEILEVYEAQENQNEAQINELGRQFRSSHQANKVGKGMVGGFRARALCDVFDKYTGAILIAKDQVFDAGPGNMPHDDRLYYWQHRHEIEKEFGKFKFFPKGIKDKPRFPTFVCIRAKEDM